MAGVDAIAKLLETAELPGLGPERRAGTQSVASLNRAFDDLFARLDSVPRSNQTVARSLVLLWHDHLDEAHELAQSVENQSGAFAHGIMHRREPDYFNAKYWFRRVGKHPAFAAIASTAESICEKDPALLRKLLQNKSWDSVAFVDLCEEAANEGKACTTTELLRQCQAIESKEFLYWLLLHPAEV